MVTSMANYAIVENGIVTNVIVGDGNSDTTAGGWCPPEGSEVIEMPVNGSVGIGSTYSNGTFSAPPAPTAGES